VIQRVGLFPQTKNRAWKLFQTGGGDSQLFFGWLPAIFPKKYVTGT
jgi:hypothetical protein